MLRRLSAAALLLALAGCASILPQPAPVPQLYRLTPAAVAAPAPRRTPVPLQLLVDVPSAPAAIDTQRLALSRGPTRLDYFAAAAWTDTAPRMLQSLIVSSLESAGGIKAVARDTLELLADVVLMSDLQHFEAAYQGAGPPTIRIEIACRLVRMPDRSIVAARRFTATAPARANDVPAIVDAFNDAFHQVMRQIEPWTAASLGSLARTAR